MSEALREAARRIFAETLRSVDVRAAVRSEIAVQDDVLTLGAHSVPLKEVDQVLLVAMGKAAVPMYQAAAGQMAGVPQRAVVVAPRSTLPAGRQQDDTTLYLPGAHPIPTAESLRAADAVLNLLASTTDRTIVLFLISGGASAMVERPLSATITLDDLAVFSRALVGSGMGIEDMNTLRKHLSAVKGGRLAVAAAAARLQCSLLVSDVPAASPDAIASGPSLPDSTTIVDARLLALRLNARGGVPDTVAAWFHAPDLPETPRAGEAAFARAGWKVILSSDHLAAAAARAAEAAGFHAEIDNTPDDWDYREAATYLLQRSATLAGQHQRTCLVSVGEVNVTLPMHHGEGGRNQHLALWCAAEMARSRVEGAVLSAGSDGVDGHSSAAGAVGDETTTDRAVAVGWSVQDALTDFNAAPLLEAVADAIHTGPTGNNLRDLRLILSDR